MIAGILLDTCAAMYIVEQEWMQPDALRALDEAFDRGDTIWVSPITGWEIGTLASKNRFKSRYTPRRWLETLLAQPRVRVAELTAQVMLESSSLPGALHRDPADRILAATAREYGYTLMTRDRALLAYAREGHLSALEC
jgi:PIN domain nuclease of toxin-antitoxin system